MVYKNPDTYQKPIVIPLPTPPEPQTPPDRLQLEPGMILRTRRGALYLIVAIRGTGIGDQAYYLSLNPTVGIVCGAGSILAEFAARELKLVGRVEIDLSNVEWYE